MGNTSSQPSPLPPQRAVSSVVASPSAKHGPHYNPEFDDFAASQQLLGEYLRSEDANFSPTLQITSREASRKASPSPSLHILSQPRPRRSTEDHETVQGHETVEAPSDEVDAPQSQTKSLPPPTTSTGTPRTRSSRKRKRNLPAEVDAQNILPEQAFLKQSEDEMPAPSALRSRRKRKHADAAESGSPNQAKSTALGPTTHKKARRELHSSATSKRTEESGNVALDVRAETELSHHEPQLTHITIAPDSLPQSSLNDSNQHTGPAEVGDVEPDEGGENHAVLPIAVESVTKVREPSKFTSINGYSSSKTDANGNGDDGDYSDDKSEREDAFPNVGTGSDVETMTALDNGENDNHNDDVNHTKPNIEPRDPAKKAPKKPSPANKPRKMPRKVSQKGKSDAHSTESDPAVMSAAEKALNTERRLNPEPDVRSEGAFTNDEEERVRRAILNYKEKKGLDIPALVEIIQLRSESQGTWKTSSEQERLSQESKQFWSELQQICPKRAYHNFRTQVRARYHLYKSGTWSEEEDDQLRKLTRIYPNQWPLIYQMMPTRSPPSIQNRWRDYVQYGDTRATKRWTEEDEELFIRAVSIAAQRGEDERAAAGKPPVTHYTRSDIDWKVVCVEMGKVRNRIQCAEHWEVMSARSSAPKIRVEIKPRRSHRSEETVHESPRKQKQPLKMRTPAKPQTRAPSKKRERHQAQAKTDENVSQDDKDAEEPRNKRRKLKRSQAEVAEQDLAGPSQNDTLTAVSSNQQALSVPEAGTLDVSKMRIGDKVNLLTAIINGQYGAQEEIDWQKTFETMERSWPVETLQAGWKDLLTLVDKKQDFGKVLDDMLEYLADHHGDEWDNCYIPLQGADVN